MSLAFRDYDDIIFDIARRLFEKCFVKNTPEPSIVRICWESANAFYNYMRVFDEYSRILDKSPLFRQMMEILDVKNRESNDIAHTIFNTNSDLVLKYVMENNNAKFTSTYSDYHDSYKCMKYLYENTDFKINVYLDNMCRKYGDFIHKHKHTDKYLHVKIGKFIKLNIRKFESVIAKYQIPYGRGWIMRVSYSLNFDEKYLVLFIDVCMRHYDQCTVFEDVMAQYQKYSIIEDMIEKYNIAGKFNKKIDLDNINDIRIAICLMKYGLYKFNEDDFWAKFKENTDYHVCLLTNGELQLLYDKSTCSTCLRNNLKSTCGFDGKAIAGITAFLNKRPPKICSACRSAKIKKVKK
jgi:hypothetical protein